MTRTPRTAAGRALLETHRYLLGSVLAIEDQAEASPPAAALRRFAVEAIEALGDHALVREHTENQGGGGSYWRCIPIAEAIEAVGNASPSERLRAALALPAEAQPGLDVDLLERAADVADRHGWIGPTIEARRRAYAERVAAEYDRLAAPAGGSDDGGTE
jgi:hypothetical protein